MKEGLHMIEPAEIPLEWEVVEQGEVATFYNGRAYKLSEWENEGTPVIRLQNLTGSGKDYYYSNLKLPEHQYCHNGDLLYMWSATFGPVWWKLDKAIFHYHIWKIDVDQRRLDKTFHYYLLDDITFKMKSQSHGSTMMHVTKGGMEKFKISLPPLLEQQKIATILSTVDEKIEVIDAQITQTRELKKGLMQKLLTRGIGHTKFKDSVLGEIPESWEVSNLESHSHFITKGSTPTTYGFEWQESGITFLRSECVSPNGFILSGAMHISEEANNAMERSKIKGGDILMTITGNVGRTCIYPMEYKEGNINQHIARIRISDSLLLPQFVFQYLSQASIITEYLKITTGQAYPQLSLKQVRETKIPLPSIEEQRKIASILSTIDEKIKIQQEKKTEYQELKKGLMQQLLTGKVRVMESTVQAV